MKLRFATIPILALDSARQIVVNLQVTTASVKPLEDADFIPFDSQLLQPRPARPEN